MLLRVQCAASPREGRAKHLAKTHGYAVIRTSRYYWDATPTAMCCHSARRAKQRRAVHGPSVVCRGADAGGRRAGRSRIALEPGAPDGRCRRLCKGPRTRPRGASLSARPPASLASGRSSRRFDTCSPALPEEIDKTLPAFRQLRCAVGACPATVTSVSLLWNGRSEAGK